LLGNIGAEDELVESAEFTSIEKDPFSKTVKGILKLKYEF
jgi:hypothetical protein